MPKINVYLVLKAFVTSYCMFEHSFPATLVFVIFHHWVIYRETLLQHLSYVGYSNAAFALGLFESHLLHHQYRLYRPNVVIYFSTRRSPQPPELGATVRKRENFNSGTKSFTEKPHTLLMYTPTGRAKRSVDSHTHMA